MVTTTFTVDAASVLKQCECELESQGPAAIGLRFGCREIRRYLGAIASRALALNDPELTQCLVDLCVLKPDPDGVPLEVPEP